MAWPETVRKSDLKIDYYRGSGPGGQHRNKTSSACRITHLPTELVAQCEEHKKQGQNRKHAFLRLAEQLVPIMREALISFDVLPESSKVIRTYHEKNNRVKDHRIPGRTWIMKEIVNGKDLHELIEEVQREKGRVAER